MDNGPHASPDQKPDYAKSPRTFANSTPMQSAMRELHSQLNDKRFWLIFAAIVVILTVSGPFGTGDDLSWPALLVYWAITGFASYMTCLAASMWITAHLTQWRIPQTAAQIIAAIPAGILVFAVVYAINRAARFTQPPDALSLLVQCILISMAINAMFVVLGTNNAPTPLPATKPNLVLEKLPLGKRGALIRIETQDHYLAVTTTKGQDLTLMRMGDAVTALGETGVQTHRSHWVAKSSVTGSDRQNNRWVLTLTDGSTVPVSRPYIQSLRDHGLLR